MAAEGLLRPVYEGCIAGCDDVERRPYHRNCGCALHKSRRKANCSHAAKSKTVSYPIRRSWSEGCLALVASSCSSPSSSPVISKTQSGVNLCDEDEDSVQFVRI